MQIEETLLQAYLIGWAVAAPIGPVNLEIIRRGLSHRIAAGFLTGLGATTADLLYVLATGFGLAPFLGNSLFLRISFVVGGVFLLWLGGGALREGYCRWRAPSSDVAKSLESTATRVPLHRHWMVGLGMTLSNPMTIVFWATLPSLLFRNVGPSSAGIVGTASVVWLGAFSWVCTLTLALIMGRKLAGERLIAGASLAGGAIMLYFALRFWWLAMNIDQALSI